MNDTFKFSKLGMKPSFGFLITTVSTKHPIGKWGESQKRLIKLLGRNKYYRRCNEVAHDYVPLLMFFITS